MRYLTLKETAIFHGHLGPFLTIGYRAGELARRILNPINEHDLQAKLILPLKRPYTCIIDGVQCSTKCTLGKLNIQVIDNKEDEASIIMEFICLSRRKGIRLRVKENIIRNISKIKDLKEGANWVSSLSVEELFEISMIDI